MRAKVFSFIKPTPTQILVSARAITPFLAGITGAPVCWGDDVAEGPPLHVLFIVNGPYAFCGSLPALGRAVETAKRIIWVQNDYIIKPPSPQSNAGSPFRAAFRNRHQRGMRPIDYWTTVRGNATATPESTYVNWNALAYLPLPEAERARLRARAMKDVFYYGSFREGRAAYFDRYLLTPPVRATISGKGPKWEPYAAAGARVVAPCSGEGFYRELAGHGLGLYLEDTKSHREFHSPANRFYEMLAAGLPMVFQPEAAPMLANAGIDVANYVVRAPADLTAMMRKREQIGGEQRALWGKPWRRQLERRVATLWGQLKGRCP